MNADKPNSSAAPAMDAAISRNVERTSKHVSYSEDSSLHAVIDLLFTVFALYIANIVRLYDWLPFENLDVHVAPPWLYPLVCVVWLIVFSYYGVYDRRTPTPLSKRTLSIVRSVLVSTLLIAGALYFSFRELSRGYFLIFVVINIISLLGWRYVTGVIRTLPWVNRLTPNGDGKRRVLVVGANFTGNEIVSQLLEQHSETIKVVGVVDDETAITTNVQWLGGLENVRSIVIKHNIHDIVIALSDKQNSRMTSLILSLEDLPVVVRVIPDYRSMSMFKTQAEEFGGIALMNLRAPALDSVQRLFKRLLDMVVSTIAIILLLPVFLVTAILIKIESKGPVFFIQERIGENGRRFKMFKFRSMVQNAEAMQESINQVDIDGAILHKKRDDQRVTKVGRFIRSKSIDELPQLFNVLIGDMSLVGPRPELPWLVDQYDRFQRRRFAVPQGITGWWQVNGRSDKPLHLNTDDDLLYINNYSLWLDIIILFKTPKVVLTGKGAF